MRGDLRVSVPPAALAVFAAPETPVRDQVTYQVSTEHGRLLAGRLDFGTRPAFDAAGLADAGTYTDTVEGQPVHVAAVVRTMYDAGRTERHDRHDDRPRRPGVRRIGCAGDERLRPGRVSRRSDGRGRQCQQQLGDLGDGSDRSVAAHRPAALLASGSELHTAVGESLAFLDQALDAGFRPGMGHVVPDRFFWALAPGEEEEGADGDALTPDAPGSRHIH